jgi:hypothetical protein
VDYTLLIELLIDSCIETDPVEDGLMPQQTVVPLRDPVALVWEVQEAAGNAKTLQNVERLQALLFVSMTVYPVNTVEAYLADQDTVVQVV